MQVSLAVSDAAETPGHGLGVEIMEQETLTIAIPNKGRLAASAKLLVKELGFENGNNDREYAVMSSDGKYRFLLARAKDIPNYVESKVADVGITGRDLVYESNASVTECFALPFGICRLVYAVPKNSNLTPRKVATAFPNLAAKYLSSEKLDAKIINLDGAIESSISAGVADAIIDLASTGKTLEANGLEEIDEVMKSSAIVIANAESLAQKKELIDEALGILRGDVKLFSCSLDSISSADKKRILFRNQSKSAQAGAVVKEIFENVRKNRDDALAIFTEKFDDLKLNPEQFEVTQDEIKEAYSFVDQKVILALKKAAENISRFSKKELPERWEIKIEGGLMGKRIVPLDVVGVYAPGGTAAYPSSVLMGVVPAKVAGVREIILCTPCSKSGKCNPVVLVAADIAGTSRIFRLGGAQAIAAMAFGTRTVPRVNKIVGPGNVFVSGAKLEALSRGLVSIDSPAGPSEVMIIADETADAAFVAADMLAQAEHDTNAAAVLLSTSKSFIGEVEMEIKSQIMLLPRKAIARKSLSENGALLVVNNISEAIGFANKYAPEHLELVVERPFAWLDMVRNAGAVFIGNYSCEASGDYAAGPNHILPTGGLARSYSGLSARDFVREMNYLKLEKRGLDVLSEIIINLAEAEGLLAHSSSVKKRFEEGGFNE